MKQTRFAIGQKRSAAARMSLRLRWLGWAIQPMRYCVRFTDIGHTGHSERQKYREGDEEDRASKRESLRSAPAFRERCHWPPFAATHHFVRLTLQERPRWLHWRRLVRRT